MKYFALSTVCTKAFNEGDKINQLASRTKKNLFFMMIKFYETNGRLTFILSLLDGLAPIPCFCSTSPCLHMLSHSLDPPFAPTLFSLTHCHFLCSDITPPLQFNRSDDGRSYPLISTVLTSFLIC